MAEKLSAWICMENPEISWRIQMETIHPGGNFPERSK